MSIWETIVIIIAVLLVFGPDKLPQLIYKISKTWAQLQKMMGDVKKEVNQQVRIEELKQDKKKVLDSLDKFDKDSE